MARVPIGRQRTGSTSTERLYSVIRNGPNCSAEQPRNSLFADGRLLFAGTSWTDLGDAFESDLEFFIARRCSSFVFVHAGAVSWKGKAIIIPGPSHSGKTTLVQALLKAGAAYYSDEFAVLDTTGSLHAFPRPLAIRHNGTVSRIAAERAGVQQVRPCLSTRLVILTAYKTGAHWQPKSVSPGEAMLGLLQNTVAARRYPSLALSALQKMVCGARALLGVRGEAGETAHAILQYLDEGSQSNNSH
jgi:hypothetical protein